MKAVLKTFEVHQTTTFGIGLERIKALDFLDVIRRMSKTTAKNWFEISDPETGESFFRSDMNNETI